MSNNILDRVNDRRMTFDFEESHKYCGANKYYLSTKVDKDDDLIDIMETLLLFQSEGISAFYHYDMDSIIHEYVMI